MNTQPISRTDMDLIVKIAARGITLAKVADGVDIDREAAIRGISEAYRRNHLDLAKFLKADMEDFAQGFFGIYRMIGDTK